MAFGLNPEMIRQNTIKSDAMEFLEAKKPFVVENSPIKTSAKTGRLIRGERNTLSTVVRQEKAGPKAVIMFGIKVLTS